MVMKVVKPEEEKVPEVRHLVLDTWTESECYWGTRPDEASLHKSLEDYNAFVKEYWGSS